jgi:hypothetical protein
MTLQLGYGRRRTGHVISLVQAANGRHYKINNEGVEHVASPGRFVNAVEQDDVPKDNRKLLKFFMYVRQRDTPAATATVDAEILFAELKEEVAYVKTKAQARSGAEARAEATTPRSSGNGSKKRDSDGDDD